MNLPDVTFALGADELASPIQDEIQWAVRHIPAHRAGEGCWPHEVHFVEVTQVFKGGRSGGAVVGALVHQNQARFHVVIKVDRVDVLRREWHAYKTLIDPKPSVAFAPVVAATPDVAGTGTDYDGLGAIVYGDVGQYAGMPGAEIRTLEEVVAKAHRDPERVDAAVVLIEDVLTRMRPVLHAVGDLSRTPSSLRELSPGLGPSLELRIEPDQDGDVPWVPDSAVFRRSLTGGAEDLAVGERITLKNMRLTDPSTLEGQNIRISLQGPVAAVEGQVKSVRGTITGVRGTQRRAALIQALAPDSTTGERWQVAETVIADPFGALVDVLTASRAFRSTSVVHGDLNARNILVTGNHSCVIDYAHTKDGAAQQGDFGWLEISLLRDVFADMGFASLVRLQRMLALADRLLDLGATTAEIETHCLLSLSCREAGVFRMLFAIRRMAHACHPPGAAPDWWQDHLTHLLLAAHRTLKFPAEVQSDAKLAAVAAAAGVATEWLLNDDPFDHWDYEYEWDARDLLRSQLVIAAAEIPATALLSDLGVEYDGFVNPPAVREVRADIVPLRTEPMFPDTLQDTATQLVSEHVAAAIIGPKESGKSAVLRAICRKVARDAKKGTGHIPVLISAGRLVLSPASRSDVTILNEACGLDVVAPDRLVLGVLHLFVDDLHLLDAETARDAVAWLGRLHGTFPLVRITVCSRDADLVPEGFTTIRLCELDQKIITAYLRRHVASHEKVDDLVTRWTEDPLWSAVELNRFGPLSRLAGYLHDHDLPDSPYELQDAIFQAQLGDDPHAALTAGELAASVLTSGTDLTPARPEFSALVAVGILRAEDGQVRFADQHARDYFAARELVRGALQEPSSILKHTRLTSWHNAFCVFAALPDSPAESIELLVDELTEDNAMLAGQVLSGSRLKVRECANRFVSTQLEVLRDPVGTSDSRVVAAAALLELADPRPLALLAKDAAAPPESRQHALRKLVELVEQELPRPVRRGAADALARSVLRLLREDRSPELVETALWAVRFGRVRRLELLVAKFVSPARPWPVVYQAVLALRVLRIVLPADLVHDYEMSCLKRLDEIDLLLRTLTSAREVYDLQRERLSLLNALPPERSRSRLLRLRFAFEIGPDVGELLDSVLPTGRGCAWSVLNDQGSPDEWLDLVRDDVPLVANAAAHRLLRDAPDHTADILAVLSGSTSGHRLLIVAAATGPGEVEDAEKIFRAALPVVGSEDLEGLSALLCAIFVADRPRGVRLAWTAATAITERNLPDRWYWPWRAALARCGGVSKDHDALLCGDDESVRLAIAALSSRRPLVRWGGHEFSEVAVDCLARACPPPQAPAGTVIDWAWAVTAVCPSRAEELLKPLLDRPDLLDATVTHMTSRGLTHRPAHGLVLAALHQVASPGLS